MTSSAVLLSSGQASGGAQAKQDTAIIQISKVVPLQASILDQPWEGAFALPSREEIADIPMPELPNVEPPSPKTQFETIAQYLQVCFTGSPIQLATAVLLLCYSFATALLLLCYCCATALLLLCYSFATALLLLCYCLALTNLHVYPVYCCCTGIIRHHCVWKMSRWAVCR